MEDHRSGTTKNIGIAFFLNLSFTIIEFIGGILTGSIAIISDAIHDLGDSLSLGVSWFLQRISDKKPNKRFTFGYKRFSVLGALLNAIVLIGGSIYVLFEAGKRLFNPVAPNSVGMMVLAVIGIAVNGYAGYRMHKGSEGLNASVLSWHLIEDVLGWFAVFIVGVILQFKSIPILDPILSIAISLFILFNVIRKLNKTLLVLLDAVPEDIDLTKLKTAILKIDGIHEIRNLHIWSLDGEEHVAMIKLETNIEWDDSKKELKELMEENNIKNFTVEIINDQKEFS